MVAMNRSKLTPARIAKAIKFRLKKLGTVTSQVQSPARTFGSTTELRDFALKTQNTGSAFRYEIQLAQNYQLLGLDLKIGQLKEAEIALKNSKVSVSAKFSAEINEGYFAWAVTRMLAPALSPSGAMSVDVSALGPAAAGEKLALGPIAKTDAAEMELQYIKTLEVQPADFDLALFNPIGLRLKKRLESPEIANIQVGAELKLNGAVQKIDEHLVANLRNYVGAELEILDNANPSFVTGLAASGLVLHSNKPVSSVHPELSSLISNTLPDTTSSNQLEWIFRSEAQRRIAMLKHSTLLTKANPWPEVSILLVTNRLSMVGDALKQIALQTYPNFVVKLALHGISEAEASKELKPVQKLLAEKLHVSYVDSKKNLGEIYGELTEQSTSEYIAKFDDDDLYGPHHLWDAIISMRYSGAGLFGRTPQLTWLETTGELLLRPFGDDEVYNKYIIGPTMVINRAALMEVGGWRPTPWAVDKALIDRFQQYGGGIYRAGGFGWVYVRHDQGHTWLRDESHFRNQAEKIWTGEEAVAIRNRATN
jgi:hypothetical protein